METSDEIQSVVLLECNLDDMTGEALGYCMEGLLQAGALDVWFTPIYMKKNRPAVVLAVLCFPADEQRLSAYLLRETSTLGVRVCPCTRRVAGRSTDSVETPWGTVRRKLKLLNGQVVAIKPEYEDCARLARIYGLPLQRVLDAARNPAGTVAPAEHGRGDCQDAESGCAHRQ